MPHQGKHRAAVVAAPVGHPWLRRLVAVASSFIMVLTAISGGAVFAFNDLGKNIRTVDTSGLDDGSRPTAIAKPTDTSPLNFLIMGSDSREGDGNVGYGDVSGARSDTTLLVHFYEGRESAVAISIPRDSYVTIPVCEGNNGEKVGPWTTKFNAAFAIGGPVCTIKTIESVTGIRVDKFVVVDFNAFKKVVDAIGGVRVCMTTPVYDPYVPGRGGSGLNLPAGYSTISGKQALAFVRARESIGDGSDIGRIQRQQEFVSSMIRGMEEKGVLRNPAMLYRILAAITQSLTTSEDLASITALQEFGLSFANIKPANVKFVTTPFEFKGDGNVHWIDETEKLWKAIRNGEAWPPGSATASPSASASPSATTKSTLITAPEDIQVKVFNGTTTVGLAKKAAASLKDVGFNIMDVASAKNLHAKTEIYYSSKFLEAAKTLQASIGGAVLVKDETLTDHINLFVSSSWKGAKAVTVAAPTPSASESSPSDPGVVNAGTAVCSEGNNRTKTN